MINALLYKEWIKLRWVFWLVLLGGLLVAMTLGMGIQYVILRGKGPVKLIPGEPRRYGLKGGTICPHCGWPYPLSLFGIHVTGFGQLDRCEACGKWAWVRRRPAQDLREAEQKFYPPPPVLPATDAEDHLRGQVENSRYFRDE